MSLAQTTIPSHETEEMLRHMVDAVEDYAIYLLDPQGNVISWNSGAERNKGYKGYEVLGRNYACFFPDEAVAAGMPSYQLQEARKHGKFRDEGWRVRKNGTKFWAEIMLTALRNDSGEIVGFTKITRDRTAWREQAEALRAAKEQAEAANQAKSDFIANMSHELRTPLNAIIGFSEVLQQEIFGSLTSVKNREYVTLIHDSGILLLTLINDILDMAKLDAKAFKLTLANVDIRAIANEALHLMEHQASKAGVSLELDAGDTAMVVCDPIRVRQMILNLLSNAVKFTPAGGRVTLRVVEEKTQVGVEVSDTGIGIAAKDIPRAMSRFGQIESSLTRKTPGTGLGLPLVKQLIELHGGSLHLESELGVGTNVKLNFPREPQNAETDSA